MPATNEEQYLLELINDARLDPLKDATRYLSSYTPPVARQDNIQSAINYFQVSGSALQQAYVALPSAQPLAWNDDLATGARQHDQAMISGDSQSHQLPGEPDLGSRESQAGYVPHYYGENIFAYSQDPLYAHAGFMIDWGNAEPGHRDNIMSANYRDVGVGILPNTNSDPGFGPQVVTEDFGSTTATNATILGVAYNDSNADDFYSIGEGVGGLNVSVAGTAATSASSGGYTLQTNATGPQQVTLAGAGLAGPVLVDLNLAPSSNVKLDVVNGTTVRTSASATFSGFVSRVEALGTAGLSITTSSGAQTVEGTAGADSLAGGADNDALVGNDGGDLLLGNTGDDLLLGNAGNDVAFGGQDQDAIYGGQNNDALYGNLGNDMLVGNLGDDLLNGGQGDDLLVGGQGNDLLTGGLGNNTLVGGQGADTYQFLPGGGRDLIQGFSLAEGDRLDLQGQTYAVGSGADGWALVGLSGGGSIDIAGVTQGQVTGDFFAARA